MIFVVFFQGFWAFSAGSPTTVTWNGDCWTRSFSKNSMQTDLLFKNISYSMLDRYRCLPIIYFQKSVNQW